MTRAVKKSGKIDAALEKAVDKLLKEVTLDQMDEYELDGERKRRPRYSLNDVLKVIDRKTKLEAIKQKADDAGYGTGFGMTADDDKEED